MERRTVDRLVGDWRIVQLKRGHRFNTDDVLTAWVGLQIAPQARRMLDLGSGVGSIGLIGLHHRPSARLTSVEVQAISVACQRATLALNGLYSRVALVHSDLRDLNDLGDFDLITGNPPYIEPGKGKVSPHPQRAAARIELHGDVFDYARAAAERLAPEGSFVLCHAASDPRPPEALREAGLPVLGRLDVVFREGRAPLISIWAAGCGEAYDLGILTIRDQAGAWTPAWRAVREELGLP